MKVSFLLLAVVIFFVSPAYAGIQAHKIAQKSDAPTIDGKLDEAIWQGVVAHDRFFQTQPFDKVVAHVRTEVRLMFDERYLYVGIKGFDPQADLIRDSFSRRDKVSIDQDFFGLYIDASGAHKSAQAFYVNARGGVMDGVYGDMSGDDTAPDYEFEVASARFEGGWSAEYRIPFSSIAYDKNSDTPWSLLVIRNMTREQRYRMYSGAVTRATSCNLCFSDAIEGMHDLPSGLNWSATPQWVSRRLVEEDSGKGAKRSASGDLSLDVKFRPTSAITIDATINPDFSQIELDSPQLSGNTKFSIFVPEKRPFFLEGADIFRSPFNVISTRSIANPDAGLRYTQRDAGKDFSVLTARDAAGGVVLIPHTYFTGYANNPGTSVASDARLNFRRGALSVGAFVTDRRYQGRGDNRVAGPDFVWQIDQNQVMRGQFLMSATTAQVDEKGNIVKGKLSTGHAGYLDWSKGNDAWGVSASVRDISQDFRADNGFFSQVGFRSLNGEMSKKFGKTGIFNELNLTLGGEYKLDSEGRLVSKNLAPGVRVTGAYDSAAYLHLLPFLKNRVSQEGEAFKLARLAMGFGISPSQVFARVGVDFSFGDVIDLAANRLGRGGSYAMSAKLRPHDRLEIEPSLSGSWIERVGGNSGPVQSERAYTETALQMNGIVHLSPKDTIRMILQDARTRRNPAAYAGIVTPLNSRSVNSFVFAHRAALGNALYLGWTSTKSHSAGSKRQQRELFMKLSLQI